jgi:hypothetical protein
MEGSAAQCIDQGVPTQCTGRQVSPRVESCVRWQDIVLFSRRYSSTLQLTGARDRADRLHEAFFNSHQTSSHFLRMCLSADDDTPCAEVWESTSESSLRTSTRKDTTLSFKT